MAKLIPVAAFVLILSWALMELERRGPISFNELAWVSLVAFAAALAAAGTIEVAKRIFMLRGFYQRHAFRRWLASGIEADQKLSGRSPDRTAMRSRLNDAERQLLTLAGIEDDMNVKGEVRTNFFVALYRISATTELFDLSTEQFAAQLADAADRAVSDPETYEQLSAGVAMGHQRDVAAANSELLAMEIATRRAKVRATSDEASRELAAARENLRERKSVAFAIAQKRVQAFQISTGRGWRRTLSVITVGACSLLAWMMAVVIVPDALGLALLFGLLLCPPVAWFLRDIAAGVERWRNSS